MSDTEFNIPQIPKPTIGKFIDLEGRTFTRLTVLAFAGRNTNGQFAWICRCTCGNRCLVNGRDLRHGNTHSCGCLQQETRSKGIHYKSDTSEFRIWAMMLSRCLNPKNRAYKRYGGRGITVCDRWKDSFENFFADMGDKPDKLTLDRKDNNLGYSPDNCKWATRKEQTNNHSNNRQWEFRNKTQTLSQWCDELNLPYLKIANRIGKGWDIERALTQPIVSKSKHLL